MPSFILTDVTRDLWVESFTTGSKELGIPAPTAWSVTKRRLHGGRRDGVDLIEVNNGALSFAIVPTRGMGLWKGRFQQDEIGWKSPVTDGPVHPSFVNFGNWGGLGWLEGFDEWMVRCGLENNGPPYTEDKHTYGLHGKIANIPASYVVVHIDDAPPHAITVEGHVAEAKLFGLQVRMVSKFTTTPGANRLTVRDEFVSLKDTPSDMQMLYHWNFGAPYLEEGARLVAPVKELVPRDARAKEGIGHWDIYGGPEPGFAEQVYYFDLHTHASDGRTLAVLRNREGNKAVALRFAKAQLPGFTLWKCTSGRNEGYVTGLEPGTNFPNTRPFEKAHKRVVTLAPHGRYVAESTFEVVNTKEAVAALEAEVRDLQGQGPPQIHAGPVEPYAPET